MSLPENADGFVLMGAGSGFRDKICDMIGDTPLFSDLPWNEVKTLAGYVQCYEVSAGTIIFREGDSGSFMALLVEGKVEIFKEGNDGQARHLVCISRGKTVGEMAMIDNEPRSATCTAKDDSVLLVLSRRNYEAIIKAHPGLAVCILSKLAKLMSQRLRGLSGLLVEYLEQDKPA